MAELPVFARTIYRSMNLNYNQYFTNYCKYRDYQNWITECRGALRLYSFVLEDSLENDVKGVLTETLLLISVFQLCTRRKAMKPIGNSYYDCVPTENN